MLYIMQCVPFRKKLFNQMTQSLFFFCQISLSTTLLWRDENSSYAKRTNI